MTSVDISATRDTSAKFDTEMQQAEELATELLRRLADLAKRWPVDSPMYELLSRQLRQLVHTITSHTAEREALLAATRRRQV